MDTEWGPVLVQAALAAALAFTAYKWAYHRTLGRLARALKARHDLRVRMLACEFARRVYEEIGAVACGKVDAENRGTPPEEAASCESRRYCDPDPFMRDAFHDVFQREPDPRDPDDQETSLRAWRLCWALGFEKLGEAR